MKNQYTSIPEDSSIKDRRLARLYSGDMVEFREEYHQ
jgi:hypothetical protein